MFVWLCVCIHRVVGLGGGREGMRGKRVIRDSHCQSAGSLAYGLAPRLWGEGAQNARRFSKAVLTHFSEVRFPGIGCPDLLGSWPPAAAGRRPPISTQHVECQTSMFDGGLALGLETVASSVDLYIVENFGQIPNRALGKTQSRC